MKQQIEFVNSYYALKKNKKLEVIQGGKKRYESRWGQESD